MSKDTTPKSSGKKFSLKKLWKKLRPSRKTASAHDENPDQVDEQLSSCSCTAEPKRPIIASVGDGVDIDIHDVDKDRIRTTCKEAIDNPPQFPSREDVKERIENAHKYYGIKCLYNHYESEDPGVKKELQPSWYYILERPLVEQYVLMTNYIRKLSVMAALKSERTGVAEEPAIEEEVSSISSCSDYADFAPDSKILVKLKEMKKLSASPSPEGISGIDRELRELEQGTRNEETTIRTNEYTMVIRKHVQCDVHDDEVLPSESNTVERRIRDRTVDEAELPGSGDHLPDMADFDLSSNLVSGPMESRKPGMRQVPFYHWQGNSTPTKTPLLNMDSQPPVRRRAPGTARDFLSFRNLSLSPEFVDSCRDFSVAFAEECRNMYLKEIEGPDDSDEGHLSSATQTESVSSIRVPSITWKDTQVEVPSSHTEREKIIERAAVASDYIRERMVGSGMESEDSIPTDGIGIPENEHETFEIEDGLRTSESQMDTSSDFTESESASSLETQISVRPANLN